VKKEQYRGRILGLLAAILVLPALFWAAYVTLRVVSVGERDEHQPADAIVVLGAREYSGWPSSRPCVSLSLPAHVWHRSCILEIGQLMGFC
jgi:hypothetical protein